MGSRPTKCITVDSELSKCKIKQIDSPRRKANSQIAPDQDPLLKSLLKSSNGRVHFCKLSRDFELHPTVLGAGYSGPVFLATARGTGQQVAVKQFSKYQLDAQRLELLQSEVEVYLRLDHPNICRLLHVYESHTKVWIVEELCGWTLSDRLRKAEVFGENEAADAMLQMLQAVSYLHSHQIVHRDLKLENWMYGATERDDRLKLIDFGFSQTVGTDETLNMRCGTLLYTSPEVLARKYTSKCDLWSLGVICYMLLVGKAPFRGTGKQNIANAIMCDDFVKDRKRWLDLSSDAKSFITLLLQKEPSKRPDHVEALAHPWIARAATLSNFAPGAEIAVDVLMNLQHFAEGSHLRRAALTMLAWSLTSRELQDFEETFLAFDKSGRGTITKEQLADVMHGRMKVSPHQVSRIFENLNCSDDEEISYTPFIAALLATRVKLHEGKVRKAFDAFDYDRSGYITTQDLVNVCQGSAVGSSKSFQKERGLSKDEAELWISEVDYKGNGVIDYDTFRLALMSTKSWHGQVSPRVFSLDAEDAPTVKVFYGAAGAPQGVNASYADTTSGDLLSPSPSSPLSLRTDVSRSSDGKVDLIRAQSFQGCKAKVQVRTVDCIVDDLHFL